MKNATAKVTADGGKPGAVTKLPKLKIGIYRGPELVRVVELPDPREQFIATFNRDYSAAGLVAVD